MAGNPDGVVLAGVIRRLTSARSIAEITDVTTHAARQLLKADGITFVLRDGDCCHYADEDAIAPLWKGRRFPTSACISGWCMDERQPAVISDIAEDPRIPQDAYRPTFVRSLAMVPVRSERPMAAMGAYWARRHAASADDIDMLQTVADAAALTLANLELERSREREFQARRESHHRLMNLIAIVGVIARQTAHSAQSVAEFESLFGGRLRALARAQSLLDQGGANGIDIKALMLDQVLLGEDVDGFVLQGPDVALGIDAAFRLGLLLHELGTNARKYGALTREGGTVTVTWSLVRQSGRNVLALTWTERGGPPVLKPTRDGFGVKLLTQSLKPAGGDAWIDYRPEGVVCEIQLPLTPGG